MTPQEIAQCAKAFPVLKDVLQPALWRFLRQQIKPYVRSADERLLDEPANGACPQCQKHTELLFDSPYRRPIQCRWCIECILYAFFTNAPTYEEERSQELNIDSVYCWTDDCDGPPIAWS